MHVGEKGGRSAISAKSPRCIIALLVPATLGDKFRRLGNRLCICTWPWPIVPSYVFWTQLRLMVRERCRKAMKSNRHGWAKLAASKVTNSAKRSTTPKSCRAKRDVCFTIARALPAGQSRHKTLFSIFHERTALLCPWRFANRALVVAGKTEDLGFSLRQLYHIPISTTTNLIVIST